MSYFQHRFSSSNSPGNFKHSDRSISLLFMFSFGTRVSNLILELSKLVLEYQSFRFSKSYTNVG